MDISYLNKGLYNYLDVELGPRNNLKEQGIIHKLKMLENNTINHLISPYENEINGRVILRYNTKSNYVVERLFIKEKPDGTWLKKFFRQLFDCVIKMEEYLLNPSDLLIAPEYMFYEKTNEELNLICVPGYENDIRIQIKSLLEYIMKNFDHNDRDGVIYLYEMYNKVTEENFEVSALIRAEQDKSIKRIDEKCLDSITPNPEEYKFQKSDFTNIPSQRNLIKETDKDDKENYENKILFPVLILICSIGMCIKYIFFGRESVWMWTSISGFVISIFAMIDIYKSVKEQSEIDNDMNEFKVGYERQFLTDASDSYGQIKMNDKSHSTLVEPLEIIKEVKQEEIKKLVPLNNGAIEDINLNNEKKECIIGRGKNETTYRLGKSQISREHARIFKNENNIYIQDLNSTNGTYVNSNRLQNMEVMKLKKGDIVSFAGEDFFVA